VSASRARATARGLRVAITGGAGSGKSLAAECFRARGVPVFDADAIARELVGFMWAIAKQVPVIA
jgi:dephospho-CoA kinase